MLNFTLMNLPKALLQKHFSYSDYYSFGMLMPDRSFSTGYRFGFNGKEKDDEIKGSGNSLDFGVRIYDSRLGRWLALDPLQHRYQGVSPYVYTLNNPINFVDPDGRVVVWANDALSQEMKAKVETLTKKSSAFEVAYNNLVNDPHVFKVRVDSKWLSENMSETTRGVLRTSGASPSDVIFREGVKELTWAEEFFHANQLLQYGLNKSKNGGAQERKIQEWEAEANLFQVLVAAQIQENIPLSPDATLDLVEDNFFNAIEETGYKVLEGTKGASLYFDYLSNQEAATEGNPIYGGHQRKLLPDTYNNIVGKIPTTGKIAPPESGFTITAPRKTSTDDACED